MLLDRVKGICHPKKPDVDWGNLSENQNPP